MKTVNNFKAWCQKIIPLVYDNSLSYYELLCKVIDKLNETIDNLNELNNQLTGEFNQLKKWVELQIETLNNSFTELQNYVDNYFNNLNIQSEINNKLDQMVADGTFDKIINEQILGSIKDEIDSYTDLNLDFLLKGNNL